MKKVLILAYDYPPNQSVGALRPYSWAKYFFKFGIYPVVITRHWDDEIEVQADCIKPSLENNIEIIENFSNTIIKVPFKPNLRDKLLINNDKSKFKFIRKTFTFFYVFARYLSSFFDNISPIYDAADNYLKENQCDIIIATGEPFILFKYAHILSKKYNIPWIADYRDCWSTKLVKDNYDKLSWIIYKTFYKRLEKIYTKNSMFITTASQTYKQNIEKLIPNKEIHVILNGFFQETIDEVIDVEQNREIFTIAYAGCIYPHQPVKQFLDGYANFIKKNNGIKTKCIFYGLDFYTDIKEEVLNYYPELKKYIITTPKIPYKDLLINLKKSNLLLLLSKKGANWLNAKVFDYIAVNRKIILFKSDKSILESIITQTESGVFCDTTADLEILLDNYYKIFTKNKCIENDTINALEFSRENQTKKFADIITLGLMSHSSAAKIKNVFPQYLVALLRGHYLRNTSKMRALLFRILKYIGFLKILHSLKNRDDVTVLCFHRVSNEDSPAYPPIKIEVFDDILKYIIKNYNVINLSQINEKNNGSKKRLVITFDDGYKDFITYALPLLKKYNLNAVLSVVAQTVIGKNDIWTQKLNKIVEAYYKESIPINFILNNIHFNFNISKKNVAQTAFDIYSLIMNESDFVINDILKILENNLKHEYDKTEMLSIDDIKQISDAGIEIASHSMTHKILISKNVDLSEEIAQSKILIESLINKPVNTFAFPNGAYNKKVIDFTSKHYRYLLTMYESTFTPNYSRECCSLTIPRIMISYNFLDENLFKIEKFHFWIKRFF